MIFGRRYRVTEKIGAGGMAEVYKAVDETLGRTVAVKVLHPRYAADPTFAARFRQEAQAAANLQSPYIVNIYDWGQDGDTYYIVMEHVRGTDLKTMIEQKGALPSKQVAEIGAEVCSALMTAHGYDVIHRDIKPHNIMVTPDGSVKVMDFGIARAGNSTMTQTGSVLGTAHYVSPEQAQGRPLTQASDLYSLGIVLYEAATGSLPFDAETPVAVALKQVNEQATRPSRLNPDIDLGLEKVIGRALAKDPSRRYPTAEEMRRDLRRVAVGESPSGAPAAASSQTSVMPAVGGAPDPYAATSTIRPVPQRRSPWIWVAVAAVLIAAGLGVAFWMGLLGPQGVPVPELVGMTKKDANEALIKAGFTPGEITEEYSDKAKGVVIDQSPVAGAEAKKGSPVTIVVSKGQELIETPSLLGMTEVNAQAALRQAGLIPQAMPSEYNASVTPGTVFKQTPGPGEKVERGTSVQYIVSRGIETTKVPNVVGKKRSSAESTLRAAGFKVSWKEEYSDTVGSGKVISQNPGADIQVAVGSTVTLIVSKGSETVAVPDLIGKTLAEAQAALDAAGLKSRVIYEPHSLTGTVIAQNPSADTRVKRNTTVDVTIDNNAPLP
jgi:serine/threonine-protein kinase